MRRGQLAEQRLRFARQRQFHPSTVVNRGRLGEQSGFNHARGQFSRRVRRDQELFREEPDSWRMGAAVPGDGEQGLVLLGRKTDRRRRGLAEGTDNLTHAGREWPLPHPSVRRLRSPPPTPVGLRP